MEKYSVPISNSNDEELDLSGSIEQLKIELNKVQNTYHSMLSDDYIDDKELATLLVMVNKVINDSYSLKSIATNPKDLPEHWQDAKMRF